MSTDTKDLQMQGIYDVEKLCCQRDEQSNVEAN